MTYNTEELMILEKCSILFALIFLKKNQNILN